jgi:hypothetical protein
MGFFFFISTFPRPAHHPARVVNFLIKDLTPG